MSADEFTRCDERIKQSDPGQIRDAVQKADASTKGSIQRAIWNDEVLRAIESYDVDVYVNKGVVYLNGHITNSASQKRIDNAIRSMPSILEVRNHLILDDSLTLEVAGSLGALEHIYGCKFFTGTSHGVVSLGGTVNDENVKLLAERCAASNPNVRAVINHVRVAGAGLDVPEQLPFLQPAIGEIIYFADGVSGVVRQVVVNPNNRRVIAMAVWVRFPDRLQNRPSLQRHESESAERLLVIPMDTVRYLTAASGFLHISSVERERYMDFEPASFSKPNVDWTPPYPYCPADVLFPVEYQIVEIRPATAPQHYPLGELLEPVSLKQQLLAGDSTGS
jgi:osmotically-inducible protein OsmY